MRGFIEVKEDTYEDTIEHLHRLKKIACLLIKKLSEHSEIYDRDEKYEGDEEYARGRSMNRGRYNY